MSTIADFPRAERADFPSDVLIGSQTALVLFAAGFLGKQDARFVAEAGMTATCVDTDGAKLAEMQAQYPSTWEFVEQDAYEFAAGAPRTWDVLTLDPWTHDFARCAENLTVWCRKARHTVILGIGVHTAVPVPDGWRVERVTHRSDYNGGVYWLVLERA